MPCFAYEPSNQLALQRLAGADIRARTINNFKEVLQQRQAIESRVEAVKLFMEVEIERMAEDDDCSSHEA